MSELMKVGPDWGGIGTFKPFTAAPSGSQRVNDAHARYLQAAIEGRLFSIDSDSVTLAAANATKSAMGTAKSINGFYNPLASGKLAAIVWAGVATVSGTPAGPFFWNYESGVVINSADTGTIRSALLASSGNASGMVPQANVVLTTNPASTAALKQLGVLGGPAAIAAGAGMYHVADEVAGRIVVPGGTVIALMALGAGTTHVVQSTIVFEVLPDLRMNS